MKYNKIKNDRMFEQLGFLPNKKESIIVHLSYLIRLYLVLTVLS